MKPEEIRRHIHDLRSEGAIPRSDLLGLTEATESFLRIVEDLAAFDDGGDEVERTEMLCQFIMRSQAALAGFPFCEDPNCQWCLAEKEK